MIDVIFQETASEKNTWSENVTYYPFFFFFFHKCELVLKIAHIQFDFWVKHCELWQNGGRKCWGQILACCRKKKKKKKKKKNPASLLSTRQLEWFTHTVLQQEYLGRASLPAAVMKFRTFHHQQWILHKRLKYEFITQDEKHVTFATLNKMNGSLSHLHSHTFLWLCHEVNLIYW